MARSSYIYIVYKNCGSLYGAFTVKHEMISSLPKELSNFRTYNYEIYRFRDGNPYNHKQDPVNITENIVSEHYYETAN